MRYAMCSLFLFAASAKAADPLSFDAFDKRVEVLEKKVAALEAKLGVSAAPTQRVQVCDGQTCRWVEVPTAGPSCGCAACPAGTCSVAGACGQAGCGGSVSTPVYGWPQGATYSAPQITTFGAAGSCAGGQCGTPSVSRGLFGRRR
jgi:hypothetical protein